MLVIPYNCLQLLESKKKDDAENTIRKSYKKRVLKRTVAKRSNQRNKSNKNGFRMKGK